MKKLLIIFVIINSNLCIAQKFADKSYYLVDNLVLEDISERDKRKLDSILELIHATKVDTQKVYLINVFIEDCWDDNLWTKYNQWSYDFIQEKLKTGKLSKEESKMLQVFSAGALNNMGYYHDKQGNIKLALEYYNKSLKEAEKLQSKISIARLLNNIGLIHRKQNNTDVAISYYQRCLSILNELGDSTAIATVSSNLASIYYEKKDNSNALKIYQKALNIYQNLKNDNGVGMAYSSIGNIYIQQGDTASGIEFFNKALSIWEKLNYAEGKAHSLIQLGEIKFMQNNIYGKDGALELASKSLRLSQEIGYPETIKKASDLLFRIYKATNNSDKALEMYTLFIQMRDSIINIETQKAVIQQQTKYEYEKQKAVDDAEYDKKIAIEREAKEKQKIITYFTFGGVLFLAVFLGFVYNRLQITRKQRNIITEQKEEVEKAHHELEEKNHEILQSITYAKRLQQSILPPPRLVKEYMKDSFVLYMPKDIVAGDFYWIESHNNKIYFAAADCTGHGVPGAMVSMVCHNALNRALLEFGLENPSLILDKASEIVDETFSKSEDNVQDGMDISLYCLDTKTLELEWAGANNPLWMIQAGEFVEIKPDKQPVGRYENRKPFTNHTLKLNEGDSLFSITDGYADQFGGDKGKKYTYKKLREFLLSINNKPMSLQKDELITEFDKWKQNNEQVDDVCLIGVKI